VFRTLLCGNYPLSSHTIQCRGSRKEIRKLKSAVKGLKSSRQARMFKPTSSQIRCRTCIIQTNFFIYCHLEVADVVNNRTSRGRSNWGIDRERQGAKVTATATAVIQLRVLSVRSIFKPLLQVVLCPRHAQRCITSEYARFSLQYEQMRTSMIPECDVANTWGVISS
jgi:hypothetical protein